MKRFALILAATAFVHAQTPPEPKSGSAEQEQLDLSKAIGEAGSSGVDYVRALERHLAKYPESKRRAEIEKALAKSAVDANDHTRILLYGEKVLKAEPQSDDLQLLDKVTRALLDSDDAESAARALGYAKRFGIQIEAMRPKASESHMSEGAWNDQLDQSKARVLVLEARATGNMSDSEGALKLARSSWDTSPNAESARETGKWLVKLNRNAEAVEYYADAFAMDDSRTTEADRARDRARLGDMYASLNGSEKGLGDAILLAYDRVSALKRTRLAALKLKDPNAGATELLDFTLPDAAGGAPVTLSSLKGKTVVIDFWATWCGPCKVQHPMIEEIKKHYEDSGGVVFLSVDSDSDRSLVTPFIKEMRWSGRIYFDAGVARLLNVSSIPTVIVLDKTGKISSRMIGFIPERFEDMLTQRIEETRAN